MNRERERLLADLQDSVRVTLSDDGTTYRFFVDEPPQIPSHWPVTIGEVLYNLRSALDHAAYELSVIGLNRELDPDEAKNSAFPLLTDPRRFTAKNLDTWLPGVDDTTRSFIERVQPYPERDRFYRPTPFEEAAHYLGLLNELGNIEKHRHPNFVVESVGPGSHLQGRPAPQVFEGALEPGRMVAKMDYYPEFTPYVSMQPRFAFDTVLIHPGGPSAMPGVLWVMNFMVERVLDVLDPSPWLKGRRKRHLEPHPGAEEASQMRSAFQRLAAQQESET